MWNDLTMQQRADVISMAVKAGMRDMRSIRSFYDEALGSRRFENGGDTGASIPMLSSIPKLSSLPDIKIEKATPEYEEIKPKKEIPIESVKQKEPIIPGLQPQQPISDSRFSRSHPIFKDEYDYMNSDAFLTRVKKMTRSNDGARILATNMRNGLYHTNLPNKAFFDYTSNSQNSGFRMDKSGPFMHNIYYGRVNDVPGFTTRGVIAHELGHSIYNGDKYGALFDYPLLSPQYTNVLQRGRHKTQVSDETIEHDYTDTERIADIRALQQQAKDAGIWDKTTGVDMTPELYNKLKQTYPNHRSFDMWNDEDLRWLINTTAQNNTPILDDSNVNYLLANGGHLFDGESEPVNALYKPEDNVVHRVTRVNGDLVGMDPVTGRFYDNTTGNYIGDHVALEDIVVTPQNGTIDDMGNIYQTIGGITHMATPDGKHIILGEKPVSNVDPVGEFYVEGTALSPLFKPVERVVSGIVGAPEIVKSGKEYLGKAFNNIPKVLWTKGNKKVSEPPIITSENAASMTPEQWTTAQDDAVAKALNITPKEAASLTKEQYEAAIAKGVDTEELSRLRLLHNSVKAPNNKVRTDRGKGKPFILDHNTDHEPWNVYDDSYFGETDEGWFGKGLYLSGSPFGKNAYGKNKMKLLVNIENPVYAKDNLEVGLAKQFFNRGIPKEDALKILESSLEPDELDFFLKHKKLITKAIDRVYSADGVIAPLDANASLNRPYSPYHEVVVPDGRKVKSADAVTFDNNGVRIPLGKRDNFSINDIRYGLLPFGIGLTGLGLINEE